MHASAAIESPWCPRLLRELEESDRRARSLVEGLSVERLNRQPAPGVWSIGQCIEHLAIANETYLPPIAAALEGRPKAPIQEITPGWFGGWFLRTYIEPSTKTKRLVAPKKITPGVQVEPSVLERFLRSNREVAEVMRQASAHDVNRIRFPNPYVPVLRFTVGTGMLIIVGHERRHLAQAERVRQSLAEGGEPYW